jgi:hypothetical protein
MDTQYDEKISHLNDLIRLSRIDGNESLHEVNFINSVADRLGIDRQKVKEIKNDSKGVRFTPPSDMYQIIMQYHRLIVLMGIDRIITQEEKDFCLELGKKMSLKVEAIGEIIDKAIDNPRHIISVDDIEEVFYKYYN